MAAHRYWRLFISSANGSSISVLTELEMFATAGGVNQCTGGTPFSSSNYDASWESTKAFDGIKTGDQGWASSPSQTWPTWIGYDFGAGNEKDIVQFNIISRQYNPYHIVDSPKNFKLQFSDDDIWWYDAGAPFADVSGWGANETRTFDIVPVVIADKSLHSVTFPLAKLSASNIITARAVVAGESEISGKISITGTPTEDILVRLHHSDSGILVKTTKTNALGDYKFENVNRYDLFDVVAEDPLKEWEKVVSSRRTPYTSSRALKCTAYSGEQFKASVDNGKFKYWRVNISTTNGNTNTSISEIQFRGVAGGSNLATGGTAFSNSEYNGSYVASNAFDSNNASRWAGNGGVVSQPHYLAYAFTSEVPVVEVSIRASQDVAGPMADAPNTFDIQYSDDNISWTTLWSVSGQSGWANGETRVFTKP